MQIACLPQAGAANPYQNLMRAGLADAGHQTHPGAAGNFFALCRTVFPNRPGALHLDWPGSYYLRRNRLLCLLQAAQFWLDLQLATASGVPLVWTAHNLTEHDVPHPGIDRWAKRLLAAKASRVRVFTDAQRQEAAQKFGVSPDKIVAIPEGSYVGYYPEQQTRLQARQLLHLPEQARVTLHFGNLRPYKGSAQLVRAFKAVAGPNDHLVLAGPAHTPAYVDDLRTAIAGDARIHLHAGFVAEEQVQTFFRAADLAAFPFQRIDNSGSVILAMGFGLPCLAPAVGAVAGRLAAQPDLLFAPGQLEHRLGFALAQPAHQLAAWGQANRTQVLAHRWADFAQVFTQLST